MSVIVPDLTPLARIAIPAGPVQMGSVRLCDAKPVIQVTVSAFERSTTKVTIRQYDEYLGAIGRNRIMLAATDRKTGIVSFFARGKNEKDVLNEYMRFLSLKDKLSGGGVVEMGGLTVFEIVTPDIRKECRALPDNPVTMVNWWELAAFAAAHGGRLPTEAECERVMRMDNYTEVFGDENRTKVRDWTQTWWHHSYRLEDWLGPQKDPRGPKEGELKVLRGGSFYDDRDLHAALRSCDYPNSRHRDVGGILVWDGK